MRLAEQVVLVTGGGSGLGRAIVDQCIKEGARAAILDRSEERLAQAEAAHGDRVVTTAGDVRSLAENCRAVAACLDGSGKLDCAIGNAGIWDFGTDLLDLPSDKLDRAFDEIFQVNAKGYLRLAKGGYVSVGRYWWFDNFHHFQRRFLS